MNVRTIEVNGKAIEIEFENVNYRNCVFDRFYADKNYGAEPGWFVWGENREYYGTNADGRGAYRMVCARPNVKARKHPHYNNAVRRGFHTKREAQAVADVLNSLSAE